MDRWPNTAPLRPARCWARRRLLGDLAEVGHVLDRYDHLDIHVRFGAGVDDLDRSPPERSVVVSRSPTQEPRDLLQRTLRCRQTDALDRPTDQVLEPFQTQRHVRAALGSRDRVDLVDDHRIDVAQRFPRC